MKSLTFYVSKSNKELYEVMETLKERFGIDPIMFPENNRHPVVQSEWIEKKLLKLEGDVCVMTHSSTIISCVGDYIDDVDPEFRHKVKIVILPENEDGDVIHSTFDEEGCLIDWPIGFFSGRC